MPILAAVVAFLILLFGTLYYNPPWYRKAAVAAFFGHIFISFAVVPRLPYHWDIGQFHRTAVEVASGTFTAGSATVSSFGGFQGLTYTVFAPQPETVAVFNGLFAILLFIPISSLARYLYPKRTDSHLGLMLIVLFAPLQFLFLSIPIRDTLTILVFFLLLAIGLAVLKSRHLRLALFIMPLYGMLFLLRPELAFVYVLGLVASATVKIIQAVTNSLPLQSLTFIFGGVGVVGFGLFAGLLYPFESVNDQLAYRSRGGAVYLDGMQYHSWFDFLLAAPARGLYFQFAPFPLHVESLFHLLGFAASLLIIVLFVAATRSLYECSPDETAAIFLVVVYTAGVIGYGTINSNFGTNVRHRIIFDFLLVVFATPVIQRWELLIREWLGVVPNQGDETDEQQRETEKLDRSLHVGKQNTDDAG
jgi:hypothetical protein